MASLMELYESCQPNTSTKASGKTVNRMDGVDSSTARVNIMLDGLENTIGSHKGTVSGLTKTAPYKKAIGIIIDLSVKEKFHTI